MSPYRTEVVRRPRPVIDSKARREVLEAHKQYLDECFGRDRGKGLRRRD